MTTKWQPAATTMELLSRASAADEANRPMGIDELLLLPPELSPDSGAGPLMDDFNGAVAEWRRQRAEAAAAKKAAASASTSNQPQGEGDAGGDGDEDGPSFLWAVLAVPFVRRKLVATTLWRFLHDGATIGIAYLLRGYVQWLTLPKFASEDVRVEGFHWAIGILLLQLLMLVFFALSVVAALDGLQALQSCLTQSTFEKAMRLRSDLLESRKGQILSLHSTESASLKSNNQLATVFSTIPSLIGLVVSLVVLAGLPGLVAIGVVVLFAASQQVLSTKMSYWRRRFLTASDARVKKIAEAIGNIKLLKLLQYEEYFIEKILELRAAEVNELKHVYYYRAAIIGVSHCLAPALQLGIFGVVYGIGDPVTASAVFPILVLLNLLRGFLTSFSLSVSKMIDMMASLERYGKLHLLPDRATYIARVESGQDPQQEQSATASAPPAIVVTRDVAFGYRRTSAGPAAAAAAGAEKKRPPKSAGDADIIPILPVPAGFTIAGGGALTTIVGATGTGCTTLLLGLLGELEVIAEHGGGAATASSCVQHHLDPQICFCPQDAWIQNASLRVNITLRAEDDKYNGAAVAADSGDASFDVECYAAALANACLLPDLAALPAGDATECGARGVTLSGGQRSRIMVARALYAIARRKKKQQQQQQGADIGRSLVTMDSILSAVDPHVAAKLIENVIFGPILAGTTRLLVTNNRTVVARADRVIALASPTEESGGVTPSSAPSSPSTTSAQQPPSSHHGIAFDGPADEFQAWAQRTGFVFGAAASPTTASPALVEANGGGSGGVDQAVVDAVAAGLRLAAQQKRFYFGEQHKPAAAAGALVPASNDGEPAASSKGGQKEAEEGKQRLVKKEAINTRGVELSTYLWHFSRGGVCLTLAAHLGFAVWRVAHVIQDWTLSRWTERSPVFGVLPSDGEFMLYFGVAAGATAVAVILRQIAYTWWLITIADEILVEPLRALLHATMEYFDTTSAGTLLNRFGSDLEKSDVVIGEELIFLMSLSYMLLSQFALMFVGNVVVIPLVIVAGAVYYAARARYAAGLRNVRRLENVARSPVLGQINELTAVSGAASMRLFCIEQLTRRRHIEQLTRLLRAGVSYVATQEFAVFVVAAVGGLMAGGMACLVAGIKIAVVEARTRGDEGGVLDIWPGDAIAALGIANAITAATSLNYFFLMSAQTAATFTSIERIKQALETTPQEGGAGGSASGRLAIEEAPPSAVAVAATRWPSAGAIEFRNVNMRYRPGLPLVLRGLSFGVAGGKRVGICSGTGHGKSSLTLALFRLVEIERGDGDGGGEALGARAANDSSTDDGKRDSAAAGDILIDGRSIYSLSIRDLRSAISIVPQDPQLIGGELRTALDVSGTKTDADIWRALQLVGLEQTVLRRNAPAAAAATPAKASTPQSSSCEPIEMSTTVTSQQPQPAAAAAATATAEEIRAALDAPVKEGGLDFSSGQRQLLCLARVLLRCEGGSGGNANANAIAPKILVLDECSASLDEVSDRKLQEVLRSDKFRDFTILTIAHRLTTICDYDLILVLERGSVLELASPAELLRKSDSRFASMVAALGPDEAAHVRRVAGI